MKTSVHLKISPILWNWVREQAERRDVKLIQVVEQSLWELKAREEGALPPKKKRRASA